MSQETEFMKYLREQREYLEKKIDETKDYELINNGFNGRLIELNLIWDKIFEIKERN